LGSLVFASNSASCLRAGSASKIASHKIKAFLELGEALLDVFYVFSHVGSLYCIRFGPGTFIPV
jgi:hypothetical protein